MKEKGFTLIELLAVIVILAIIALIAVPVVLNIISDSKEQSNKRSIELYASALKNAVAHYQLLNNESVRGNYTTSDDKILNGQVTLTVEYEGDVVCDIIEVYENGNIYLDKCKINKGDKYYSYGTKQIYEDGEIVYFDVYNGVSCTANDYHTDNSKTGYNGIYEGENSRKTTNNQNGCLKFYAFNDDGSDKLNLLLDHNTTETVAWNSSWNNALGPSTEEDEILESLYSDTILWKQTEEPKNYEYKSIKRPYEVNYEGYKARLITADEIAQITDANKNLGWDETLD